MNKSLHGLVLLFILSVPVLHARAQTNYSFPISTIINSMPAGLRLPNGTIVKVDRVVTGTGVHSALSGRPGPQVGGTFTGITLPQYVGDHTPTAFSIIETTSSNTINGGVNNNCTNSIGFRVYFDRPTVKISFLSVDIDGTNTNPGNAEWVSEMAFNGTTFVPYTQINNGAGVLAAVNINTSAVGHSWKTLVTNTIGAAAAANIPVTTTIQRASGGGHTPDDPTGQALFNPTVPTATVTDFFLMWGLWQIPAAPTGQTSGVSPIVVSVSPDFGDAPDTYQTLLASTGASHGVVGSLTLGTNENAKADGTPSPLANTDPDDDGIAVVPVIPNNHNLSQIIPTYSLTSTFNNSTGLAANYAAWIDWNNNGTFEASEGQTASTTAGTTTGTVTFTWNNVTLSGIAGTTHTYARIRASTEAIATTNFNGALKDGEIEDYLVPFTLTLPLHLVSFTGRIDNDHIVLTWKTANEENVAGFDIEYSTNGTSFTTIGQVNAVGNGNHQYSYTDARQPGKINYYRLKMVDKNQRASYSAIVSLKNSPSQNMEIRLSPNPVSTSLTVNIPYAEPLVISIYDAKGQVVKTQKTQVANAISIDCSAFGAGVYYLKASNDKGKTETLQFVKR